MKLSEHSYCTSLRKMGKFQTENLLHENVMKYYFRIRHSGSVQN